MLRPLRLRWVCCDFVRPKYLRNLARLKTDMLRLYETQKGTLRPLRLKWVCCDFGQPKYLRDFARLKTDMLRLYETQKGTLRPLQLKMGMLRLCTIQTTHVATLCDSSLRYVATLRKPKMYVAAIATQNGYVATLRDPNEACCDFVRLKLLAG